MTSLSSLSARERRAVQLYLSSKKRRKTQFYRLLRERDQYQEKLKRESRSFDRSLAQFCFNDDDIFVDDMELDTEPQPDGLNTQQSKRSATSQIPRPSSTAVSRSSQPNKTSSIPSPLSDSNAVPEVVPSTPAAAALPTSDAVLSTIAATSTTTDTDISPAINPAASTAVSTASPTLDTTTPCTVVQTTSTASQPPKPKKRLCYACRHYGHLAGQCQTQSKVV